MTRVCAKTLPIGRRRRLDSKAFGEVKKNWARQISHVVINSNNTVLRRCFHTQQQRLPRGGDCGRRRAIVSSSNNCDPLSRKRDAYRGRDDEDDEDVENPSLI